MNNILREIGKKLKLADNPETKVLFVNKKNEKEIKKESIELKEKGHNVILVRFIPPEGLENPNYEN